MDDATGTLAGYPRPGAIDSSIERMHRGYGGCRTSAAAAPVERTKFDFQTKFQYLVNLEFQVRGPGPAEVFKS